MADGRKNNGGSREGAGRKSRAEMAGLPQLLEECFTVDDRRECLKVLVGNAKAGDMESVKLLMAYTYGKPTERHEITGKDGQPLYKLYEGFDPSQV